jgi:hypothetical protein
MFLYLVCKQFQAIANAFDPIIKYSMKKKTLLLLMLVAFVIQNGICSTIAEQMKDKTLIVIIANEEELVYSNIMDAIQDQWKLSEYKFMTFSDAKKLFSNSDMVFMLFGIEVIDLGNAKSKSIKIALSQGKLFSGENFGKLRPLYTDILGAGYITGSSGEETFKELEKAAAEKMYFHVSNFIWKIKQDNPDKIKKTEEGAVTYYCKKKMLADKKTTVLKKKILLVDTYIGDDRIALIKTNLNMPDLKVLLVDYSETVTALKRKEKDVMVGINGVAYSSDEFEALYNIPSTTKEENVETKKRTRRIIAAVTGGFVAVVGAIVTVVILTL